MKQPRLADRIICYRGGVLAGVCNKASTGMSLQFFNRHVLEIAVAGARGGHLPMQLPWA